MIAVQIFQAEQDILLGGGVYADIFIADLKVLRPHDFAHRVGELEPFAKVRHRTSIRQAAEQGSHRAALRMAAHDNVADAQGLHANSIAAAVELVLPVEVDGGMMLPTFFTTNKSPGLLLRDEFRQHARIRAGDEQRVRILPFLREFAEERTVIAELVVVKTMNAFDEPFHDKLLRERFVLGA